MDCSTLGFPVLHHLLESAQTHVHWVDDVIQPSHPLSTPSPSAFNLCQPASGPFPMSRLFTDIRQQNYWSFSFSISPSNVYSGLIPFRMNWLDLLAVQGILKSLLQHYSLKASILWHSVFFMIQLSYPYMMTGKNIAVVREPHVESF